MKIEIENINEVLSDEGRRKLLVLILADFAEQIAENRDSYCMDDFIVFSVARLAETLFNTKYNEISERTLEKLKEEMRAIGTLRIKNGGLLCTLFPTINFYSKEWYPQGLCTVCFNKSLNSEWPSFIEYLDKEYLKNEVKNEVSKRDSLYV